MLEEQDEDEIKAQEIIKEIEMTFPEVMTAFTSTIQYNVIDSLDLDFLERIIEGLKKNAFMLIDLDNFDVIPAESILEIAESIPAMGSQPDPSIMHLFHKGKWLDWELIYAIKPIRYHLPGPIPT